MSYGWPTLTKDTQLLFSKMETLSSQNLYGRLLGEHEISVSLWQRWRASTRILSRRSPLVIGYGGWEGDVLMASLKRRLQSPLPYNLYWFCHSRKDTEFLPEWLRSNLQVYIVAPPQEGKEPNSRSSEGFLRENSVSRPNMTRGF